MRTLMATGAALATLASPTLAAAQTRPEFGDRGQFILSADRLVPLFAWTRSAQDEAVGGSTVSTQTAFSFFWGSTSPEELFFTVPRLGFDYTVIPHLTVGGDLALFFTAGRDTTNHAADGTVLNPNATALGNVVLFGIAPRVGYILRLNDLVSFWLRGGISFYTETHSEPNNGGHENSNQFALDLEPQLVVTPVPHFGLTASLTGDIPLVGQYSTTPAGGGASTSYSSSFAFVGITLGMFGYF